MTIVFNLWAVLVALMVALILLVLNGIFPGLLAGEHDVVVIAVVTFVVSVAGELIGAKARLFWLPRQTPQMWTHHREVLAIAHQALDGKVAPDKEKLIPRHNRAYGAKLQDPKKRIPLGLAREVEELIEHQGFPPGS